MCNVKPANYAPAYAVACYPALAEIARRHGYALAIHGSMTRDFDVIAIPWDNEASDPQQVIDQIHAETGIILTGEPVKKPHGRIAYSLSVGFGHCALDYSFMPRIPVERDAAARRETGTTPEKDVGPCAPD